MQQRSKPPIRRKNADTRSREYLTPSEVKRLIKAARTSSILFGRRNAALILFIYRHAMRVSEGTGILWNEVFFDTRTVHIRRLKNSKDSTHVLEPDELRELLWLRDRFPKSKFVFCTRTEKRLSRRTVHEIVAKAGEAAQLPFPVHPHMLRHAKGFQLAEIDKRLRAIQDYFGHRNIQHTVHYTALASGKFKDFGHKDLS